MFLDDGGGLLKFLMTVKDKICEYQLELHNQEKRRRSTYAEGFQPCHLKYGGQKKVIILAFSPTQEKYANIRPILERLGIESLDFGLSCDLKMLLIICGKQAASSKFSCPFCDDCAPWVDVNTRRITLGDLYADYHKFQEIRASATSEAAALKKAMTCHNVIHQPLITGPMNTKILSGFVHFPELHVLLGIVSKLTKEFQRNVFPSEIEGHDWMDELLEQIAVQRTVYHGQCSFTGPQSKKLLQKIDSMESKLLVTFAQDPDRMEVAAKYVKAFRQFELVRTACFGQDLDPNYPQLIAEFMETYRSLGVSIPLKFHVLERHCQEFLEDMGGHHGLGYYSEHPFESTHNKVNVDWGVNPLNENHQDYDEKMTDFVVGFNGKQL